ncbi:hypothetical protein [Roseisolibacter agri]|uniref:Uncharacterized protein n=1 Tax=Roseisolibacter agri TaxID=2014610 RepID=A0AA37Q083_9BACT|nr:hypothetical protein [Roseisolibacter agri]GLC24260.1 hypothetical protein rosag_07730 [Roseisolibacter agri]
MRSIRTTRTRRLALALAATGTLVLGTLASIGRTPLLWPALRAVARTSPGWLDPHPAPDAGTFARMRALAAHTTAMAVQYAAMERLRAAHPEPADADDATRIMTVLMPLRRALVTQWQVAHAAADWPVALAGLGWCDQVNGTAAIALAPVFGGAELVGVAGREPTGGHSFGRVWSARERRWLYFDVWGDAVTVLALDARGVPHVLAHARIGDAAPASVRAGLAEIYGRTAQGVVHNVLAPSFGGYLLDKWRSGMRRLAPAPAAAPSAVVASSGDAAPARAATPLPVRGSDARTAAAYVDGRLRQLEGDTARARVAYCGVLRDGALAPALAGAARALVGQLGATCVEGAQLASRAPSI